MGTEKFMAFKEDGTAYRLKGRIHRFLDAEPVTNADKSNMRDTLGITGTNGDLLAANNLDDVASTSTAQENLKIPSIGLQANEVPLCGMLNSGAWLDFDAFYSEGTWTPSVSFTSSTTGLSIANADGRFTKKGNTVFITGRLQFDVGSSSGNMSIGGLPYSVAAGTYNNSCGGVSFASGLAALTSHVTLKASVGTSDITPYDWSTSGTTRLTESNFGASSIIYFSMTYRTA